MGDGAAGERDDDELDETKSRNMTMKKLIWNKLADEFPHGLAATERVRMAVHQVLEERDANETE